MTNTLSAYLEQEILSADPLRLVCMLYQAAIVELRDARRYLAAGDIRKRCAAISKACDIIGELLSSLDRDSGGHVAEQLGALYEYSLNRLLEANLKKADAPLAEVLALLTTLNEGWQEIAAKPRTAPTAAMNNASTAFLCDSGNVGQSAHSWSF